MVHLVNSNNHFGDTESLGQKSVLFGLSFFRDSCLKFSSRSRDDENGNISLRGSSDHVLDEISVTGSINDGAEEFFSFKFVKTNVDGDTSFSF